MGRIIPYIVDNKKYLKPPTRILYTVNLQGPSPRISTAFLSHPLFPRAFAGPIRREAAKPLGPGATNHFGGQQMHFSSFWAIQTEYNPTLSGSVSGTFWNY